MGRKLLLAISVAGAVLAAAVALSGCGGSGPCIILALGGNKLCGSDAAAWCRTTDSLRAEAISLGNTSDQGAQQTCNSIEQQYPQ
jgi:hypothetical protein